LQEFAMAKIKVCVLKLIVSLLIFVAEKKPRAKAQSKLFNLV